MRFTPHTLTALRASLRSSLLLCLAAGSLHAHAARPMITDDARIVDAKACQVESWVKDNKGSTEYWAIPACNFTGNLESASALPPSIKTAVRKTRAMSCRAKPCSKHWKQMAGA